jgi:hypothetical protein
MVRCYSEGLTWLATSIGRQFELRDFRSQHRVAAHYHSEEYRLHQAQCEQARGLQP